MVQTFIASFFCHFWVLNLCLKPLSSVNLFLYSTLRLKCNLCTHKCVAAFDSNTIVRFADDTAVMGLITDNNEKAYLKEVEDLTCWYHDNNLLLNVSKPKELIVDFGKKQGRCPTLRKGYLHQALQQ